MQPTTSPTNSSRLRIDTPHARMISPSSGDRFLNRVIKKMAMARNNILIPDILLIHCFFLFRYPLLHLATSDTSPRRGWKRNILVKYILVRTWIKVEYLLTALCVMFSSMEAKNREGSMQSIALVHKHQPSSDKNKWVSQRCMLSLF